MLAPASQTGPDRLSDSENDWRKHSISEISNLKSQVRLNPEIFIYPYNKW